MFGSRYEFDYKFRLKEHFIRISQPIDYRYACKCIQNVTDMFWGTFYTMTYYDIFVYTTLALYYLLFESVSWTRQIYTAHFVVG